MKNEKIILDACCGPRYMWFNKRQKNTLYIDIRDEDVKKKLNKRKGRLVKVHPDMVMDNKALKFQDNTFNLVVMDPPHIKSKKLNSSNMTKCYGALCPETWQTDLKQGLSECMRVLKPRGIFIFKWNNCSIKFNDIIKLFPYNPLFYNVTSGKTGVEKSRTAWFCFMKLESERRNKVNWKGG